MNTLIGASLPRPDALDKVTGAARYPGDLVRPGMLHLKVVFAGRPHARILEIDSAAALAAPGVVAVLTAADVPHNAYGLIDADQPVLCADVVRFVGDKVALVVAESRDAAEAAARLVRVSYEDLPVVSDPRAALEPGAPLVHAGHGSNLLSHCPIRKGDAAAALSAADVVLEGEFSTSWQDHAFLQPEAGVAYVDEQGRVVIETAGQWLHEDRRQIASVLGLPEEQVVVRYAAIGGAFGGREDLSVQHLLALAAWRLGRPVAIVWGRDESMLAHHKRHPMRVRCRWGALRDGRIVGVESEVVADGGAYASTSAEVIKVAALFASGCYEVPNISADGYAVYTNNLPSGAFRGFGAPQAQLASEVMVTRLAHALGIDPAEMRRINLYREGSIEPTQSPLPPGVSVRACMEAALGELRSRLQIADCRLQIGAASTASQPQSAICNHQSAIRRAWGLACGIKNLGYSFGFPEQATASVALFGGSQVERAEVRAGAAEVGQGVSLILRQIAAEGLGLTLDQVALISDDSAEAPNVGSASASRLTIMAGRAVQDAAAAALREWRAEERPARATAQYRPPATTALDPVTTAGRPNYAYGYAAQAVEVEVDTRTGLVRVLTVISAHDVGRAINRQQVEGQIEGGVAQALGYALLEHFQMREGQVLTPHFSSYLLPTALDTPPEIVPIILELADPEGPHGARGVAELPLVPFAPAVAEAIYNATGAWVCDQPFTPERVLAAIRAQT
ncbi:molybdopterin-dependent oxidoreductase [Oscillochloris sp. ZM17-4]|uniref:xanthine dehydrogenase family protein molybdopterin-binding subunit n=1 Tax=Oscillochloris sp. ZM17-4 TaxID=2866714 RepID=UPI001C7355AE|nr:molybdopterin cofactor-binding domain-containing protein [Oscillochloris sp. ZM17-4]MBX0327008.1 molybdopterin-dependent oxidoreductase [Oscillochloris sp. ZM17-4]